jgi:tagaturonate reductase
LSRSISATTSWADVLKLAESPDITSVFSNTTEVGIVLDEDDSETLDPPRSFPGKLTAFLHRRATHFNFDPDKTVTVIPCELIENNGDRLKEIVTELSSRWNLGREFSDWLASVAFCNTLVDRIVSGTPPPEQLDEMAESLGYADRLLTVCEPYRLFAIEAEQQTAEALTWVRADEGIIVAETVAPYRERKVRLLNGAHTILVPLALLAGRETVFDAVEDSSVGQYLRLVMLEEIVPSLDVPQAEEFAAQVIERFRNPFIEHELFGITLHGTTKMAVRVVPSIVQYAARIGKTPSSLAFGFAAYLLFMRGDLQNARRANGAAVPTDDAGERVTAAWQETDQGNYDSAAVSSLVDRVCGDESLWGTDLRDVPGFADAVTTYLGSMLSAGVPAALAEFLAAEASVAGTST